MTSDELDETGDINLERSCAICGRGWSRLVLREPDKDGFSTTVYPLLTGSKELSLYIVESLTASGQSQVLTLEDVYFMPRHTFVRADDCEALRRRGYFVGCPECMQVLGKHWTNGKGPAVTVINLSKEPVKIRLTSEELQSRTFFRTREGFYQILSSATPAD